MRATRAAPVVAAVALAPALLLPTPSSAAQPSPSSATTVTTPDADPYEDSSCDSTSEEELRFATARVLADPGISDALGAAAQGAIDGTPEELRHFLEIGRREADGHTPSISG
ncbi:ALF repeat-containing protein [Streptomyces sp. NPDC001732]